MQIKLTVTFDVEKSEGKFVSKSDLADAIIEEIEGSLDPGSLYVEDSTYEVNNVDVEFAS